MSPTRPQAPVSLGFLNSIQVSMLLARARALSPTPSLSPFLELILEKMIISGLILLMILLSYYNIFILWC